MCIIEEEGVGGRGWGGFCAEVVKSRKTLVGLKLLMAYSAQLVFVFLNGGLSSKVSHWFRVRNWDLVLDPK